MSFVVEEEKKDASGGRMHSGFRRLETTSGRVLGFVMMETTKT